MGSGVVLSTLHAFQLQHDPQRGRGGPQQAGKLAPGELGTVLGRQVPSDQRPHVGERRQSMTSGMMIGRGSGRDQLGAGSG
jgi:hypothetical protein